MESWIRGPVDLSAFLFAPGTMRMPPDHVKLDVFAVAPRSRRKNVEFFRARRHSAVHGAEQNAPGGFLTSSTLAPRPRCKNVEFYVGPRQRRLPVGRGISTSLIGGRELLPSPHGPYRRPEGSVAGFQPLRAFRRTNIREEVRGEVL